MGYYTELEALSLDELEQQFEHNGNYDDYYEEVAEYIALQGEPGLSYLKKIVNEARIDIPQLCAAIWVLSLQEEDPWDRKRLATLLQDSRERVVAAAVDSLARTNARDFSQDILQLFVHPSPYVRGSVLRYMSKLLPNEAPHILIAALKDSHPIVRENAIDELNNLEHYQALSEIRPLLYNQPETVREAARTAVKHLTVVKNLERRPIMPSETETDDKQQSDNRERHSEGQQ